MPKYRRPEIPQQPENMEFTGWTPIVAGPIFFETYKEVGMSLPEHWGKISQSIRSWDDLDARIGELNMVEANVLIGTIRPLSMSHPLEQMRNEGLKIWRRCLDSMVERPSVEDKPQEAEKVPKDFFIDLPVAQQAHLAALGFGISRSLAGQKGEPEDLFEGVGNRAALLERISDFPTEKIAYIRGYTHIVHRGHIMGEDGAIQNEVAGIVNSACRTIMHARGHR